MAPSLPPIAPTNKVLGLINHGDDGGHNNRDVIANRNVIARFLSHNIVSEWPKKTYDNTKYDHLLASRLTFLYSFFA